MKLLICSDIHGSLNYTKKILDIKSKINADKIVILGDLYYHGPRNPIPDEYNPMEEAKLLNTIKDSLIVIKGNCDAEVDEMISDFKFNDHLIINVNNKKIYLTHGHHVNIDNMPTEEIDILMYGHFHVGSITEHNNVIVCNPGSTTLPKGNSTNSYIIMDESSIKLMDFNDNVLLEYNI